MLTIVLNLKFQKLLTIVRGGWRICREPPSLGMIFAGLAICFYKSLISLNNKIFLKKIEKTLDEMAEKAHIELAKRERPSGKPIMGTAPIIRDNEISRKKDI